LHAEADAVHRPREIAIRAHWQDAELFEMTLMVWLPALLLLGLAAMGLVFAFAAGCERV
jgi:hypothetical protein